MFTVYALFTQHMPSVSGKNVNGNQRKHARRESPIALTSKARKVLKYLVYTIGNPCLLFTVYLKVVRAAQIGSKHRSCGDYGNRRRPARIGQWRVVYRNLCILMKSREACVASFGSAKPANMLWKVAASQRVCAACERCWRTWTRYNRRMGNARDPFMYDRDMSHDEDSEFGYGRGKFPDPRIDFTDDGDKSMIPIADPDVTDQLLTLAMIRRMDINDPNAQPDPYVEGNTDRYGAQPPLVRETKRPKYKRPKPVRAPRMERHW